MESMATVRPTHFCLSFNGLLYLIITKSDFLTLFYEIYLFRTSNYINYSGLKSKKWSRHSVFGFCQCALKWLNIQQNCWRPKQENSRLCVQCFTSCNCNIKNAKVSVPSWHSLPQWIYPTKAAIHCALTGKNDLQRNVIALYVSNVVIINI